MTAKENIKNLGLLSGKILVFGGVYSNLQALQAIRAIADQEGIPSSHVICTGDVIAYCAQPAECVELIREWDIQCISGNVEQQIAEGLDDCACDFSDGSRCDIFSRQWYPYAKEKIIGENLAWTRSIPEFISFDYHGKKVLVVHGSYHDTSEFVFASTDWSVKQKNFDDSTADIILSGHSGLPFIQSKNGYTWLNAGVIGMPANDGNTQTWYAILNDTDGNITSQLHTLNYDHKTAADLMHQNNLVPSYAQTLQTGIWDNMEILPDTEKTMQRQRIL